MIVLPTNVWKESNISLSTLVDNRPIADIYRSAILYSGAYHLQMSHNALLGSKIIANFIHHIHRVAYRPDLNKKH